MAELVGVFAASHGPLIARDWAILPEAIRADLAQSYRALGERLEAARADILVIISPDHWVNFFFDNLPAICIGVGDEHVGPPEPFLKDFPYRTVPGDAAFGAHLLQTLFDNCFEPSASHRLTLDHGFCIPLLRMELARLPRVVPIIVNSLQPPMPSIGRCLELGTMLAQAIASFPRDARIAVLATGGLSHSIGEPTMGQIDEAFDQRIIQALRAGDSQALVGTVESALPHTGNGAYEVRNWVVAHGAAGARGFELLRYMPVPEVYVGCAFAAWQVTPRTPPPAA
jgi:aromatic ring-opening dioxygenase catalytic subunit (LigB family)